MRSARPSWQHRMTTGLVTAALVVTALVGAGATAAQGAATSGGGTSSPVFTTSLTGGSYRYGPSMILDSGGLHVFSCSPGSGGAWDAIAYTNSTNGGATWSAETIVLSPTPGSRDAISNCDPGVVKAGSYYYIAYTSTEDPVGNENHVYVARSTSMTGPYEKWNGTGWGGNPQPIITYTGPAGQYGAGEPSLVVKDGTLYVYYSWYSRDAVTGKYINETRLHTAPVGTNWPASLTYQGVAISKKADAADSTDVKYVPAWGKFYAVYAIERFSATSSVQAWESTDGVNFSPANIAANSLDRALSNVGLSGDASGQIDVTAQNYIGYAHGSSWSNWSMSVAPISLSNDNRPAAPRLYTAVATSGAITVDFQTDSKATSYTVQYGTDSNALTSSVTGITTSPYTLTGLTNGQQYSVRVTATGPTGTSDPGNIRSVTPLNYTAVPAVSASATSAETSLGLTPDKAIDGDINTFYSSTGHSTNAASEALTLDLGAVSNVDRVITTSRQPSGLAGPWFNENRWSIIQTSTDGTNWHTEANLTTTRLPDARQQLDFEAPRAARYVKIHSNLLNPDDLGVYRLQIAEVGVYSVPGGASSSSVTTGFPASNAVDALGTSFFSSALRATAANTESLTLDLGAARPVSRVALAPRVGGLGFPVDFSIQTSTDGTSWTAVPGQSYVAYTNPGSTDQSFVFANTVNARYVKLVATKLGADDASNYALQLVGLAVDHDYTSTATASSSASGALSAAKAVDGLAGGSFWSSAGHATASSTEWVQVDLGSAKTVRDIYLTPREDYGFPRALKITYSVNGTTWTDLPGQSYAAYPDPAATGLNPDPVQRFFTEQPVSARYIRITATQLRADNFGTYYFQLAEVSVRG